MITTYHRALDLSKNVNETTALFQLGFIQMLQGNFVKMMAYWERGAEEEPRDSCCLLYCAEALLGGKYSGIQPDVPRALQLLSYPFVQMAHGRACYYVGRSLYSGQGVDKKDVEKGLSLMKTGLRKDPVAVRNLAQKDNLLNALLPSSPSTSPDS
jgi:hypothetical protein